MLTLSNPLTMLSFAAMFAGLGVGVGTAGGGSVGWLVAGVFIGSASWWLILSTSASLARSRMTPERMRWVNRASGAIIAAFGVAAWISAG
jgi:threonine/homoserine/homoserine lactone efflux protein